MDAPQVQLFAGVGNGWPHSANQLPRPIL